MTNLSRSYFLRRKPCHAFIAILLFLFLFLAGCAVHKNNELEGQRVTLLHFNDLHGYVAAHRTADGTLGGMARIKALVDEIREENDEKGIPTLVLFAGDMLQGSTVSSLFHGEIALKTLNATGLDAAVIGNHEFDYGRKNLETLATTSRFPWLAGNLLNKVNGQPVFPSCHYVELANGLRVAVVGVTTEDLTETTAAPNVASISMDAPGITLQEVLPEADARSDLLILLSHCGSHVDRLLAASFPDVDVIVGGHNHFLFRQPQMENNVAILQAGKYGEYLGRADMMVKNDRMVMESYRVHPITKELARDPQVAATIDAAVEKGAAKGREVIGATLVLLNGETAVIRRQESNLGNYVCDLIKKRFDSDVVLLNGGGFRASIPAGPITTGDVLRVFPFGNTLVKMSVSGSVIRQAIDHGLSRDPESNPGGFLQVGGLSYRIGGNRAVDLRVNGKALDVKNSYTLMTNGFLASGGDGFSMFKEIPDKLDSGYTLADVVMDAIRETPKIQATTDGRIQRISPWMGD